MTELGKPPNVPLSPALSALSSHHSSEDLSSSLHSSQFNLSAASSERDVLSSSDDGASEEDDDVLADSWMDVGKENPSSTSSNNSTSGDYSDTDNDDGAPVPLGGSYLDAEASTIHEDTTSAEESAFEGDGWLSNTMSSLRFDFESQRTKKMMSAPTTTFTSLHEDENTPSNSQTLLFPDPATVALAWSSSQSDTTSLAGSSHFDSYFRPPESSPSTAFPTATIKGTVASPSMSNSDQDVIIRERSGTGDIQVSASSDGTGFILRDRSFTLVPPAQKVDFHGDTDGVFAGTDGHDTQHQKGQSLSVQQHIVPSKSLTTSSQLADGEYSSLERNRTISALSEKSEREKAKNELKPQSLVKFTSVAVIALSLGSFLLLNVIGSLPVAVNTSMRSTTAPSLANAVTTASTSTVALEINTTAAEPIVSASSGQVPSIALSVITTETSLAIIPSVVKSVSCILVNSNKGKALSEDVPFSPEEVAVDNKINDDPKVEEGSDCDCDGADMERWLKLQEKRFSIGWFHYMDHQNAILNASLQGVQEAVADSPFHSSTHASIAYVQHLASATKTIFLSLMKEVGPILSDLERSTRHAVQLFDRFSAPIYSSILDSIARAHRGLNATSHLSISLLRFIFEDSSRSAFENVRLARHMARKQMKRFQEELFASSQTSADLLETAKEELKHVSAVTKKSLNFIKDAHEDVFDKALNGLDLVLGDCTESLERYIGRTKLGLKKLKEEVNAVIGIKVLEAKRGTSASSKSAERLRSIKERKWLAKLERKERRKAIRESRKLRDEILKEKVERRRRSRCEEHHAKHGARQWLKEKTCQFLLWE